LVQSNAENPAFSAKLISLSLIIAILFKKYHSNDKIKKVAIFVSAGVIGLELFFWS